MRTKQRDELDQRAKQLAEKLGAFLADGNADRLLITPDDLGVDEDAYEGAEDAIVRQLEEAQLISAWNSPFLVVPQDVGTLVVRVRTIEELDEDGQEEQAELQAEHRQAWFPDEA